LDAAALFVLEVDVAADLLLVVDLLAVFAPAVALVDMRSELILSQSLLDFPLESAEQSDFVPEFD